jgi:hypothetical protein
MMSEAYAALDRKETDPNVAVKMSPREIAIALLEALVKGEVNLDPVD